jgi:hypothetical protein
MVYLRQVYNHHPSIRILKNLAEVIPRVFQIGVELGFPINGSPDQRITRSSPPPPRVIPDWRRFQRDHPKPSQIGVGFSDYASFGVDLVGSGSNYPITKLPIYSILPSETWQVDPVQIFVFSKSFVRHLTLRCCHTIAVFFARINCESGHVLFT